MGDGAISKNTRGGETLGQDNRGDNREAFTKVLRVQGSKCRRVSSTKYDLHSKAVRMLMICCSILPAWKPLQFALLARRTASHRDCQKLTVLSVPHAGQALAG